MAGWKSMKVKVKREGLDPLSGFLFFRGSVGISYDEVLAGPDGEIEEKEVDGFSTVTAYFPGTVDVRGLRGELRHFVSTLAYVEGFPVIESAEVEDFGWAEAWKEFFRPIRVGKSIVVSPSWEKPEIAEGDIFISLDPGEAFGTGSHETTKLCMELIEDEFQKIPPEVCLDIGCGTGILGILMAKMGAASVTAIDSDGKAVTIAGENAEINGVGGIFHSRQVFTSSLTGPFDFIAANIVAETLVEMKDEISHVSKEGSRLALSGILIDRVEWVSEEFIRSGFSEIRRLFQGSWGAILMKKE